jgi:hypothetical protein
MRRLAQQRIDESFVMLLANAMDVEQASREHFELVIFYNKTQYKINGYATDCE